MPYAEAGSQRLHYDITDLVPPWRKPAGTIMLHHGIGVDSQSWAEWLPVLADRWRVVRLDMRGFGRSADAAAGFDWSVANLVADLFAVADAAGAERFHIAGKSMGGTLAMAAALAKPERIASVTVSNGAHLGASIKNLTHWQETYDKGGAAGWSRMMMPDRFFDDGLSPEMWAWYEANQASQKPGSVMAAIAVLVGADLTDRLGEISQPVLLLHGDSSPFIPVSVMAELHGRLRNSAFQVFPHQKHGLPFSNGPACARAMKDFLATLEG